MIKNSVVERVYKRDNYICQYCGGDGLESLDSWHNLVVDRFTQKKGYAERNLITACHYCNNIKGTRVFRTVVEARGYVMSKRIELIKKFLKLKKKVRG